MALRLLQSSVSLALNSTDLFARRRARREMQPLIVRQYYIFTITLKRDWTVSLAHRAWALAAPRTHYIRMKRIYATAAQSIHSNVDDIRIGPA